MFYSGNVCNLFLLSIMTTTAMLPFFKLPTKKSRLGNNSCTVVCENKRLLSFYLPIRRQSRKKNHCGVVTEFHHFEKDYSLFAFCLITCFLIVWFYTRESNQALFGGDCTYSRLSKFRHSLYILRFLFKREFWEGFFKKPSQGKAPLSKSPLFL